MTEEQVFTLDCKDVILREFIAADVEAFHALTWQPDIYGYLPGWNVSKEQRENWLLNYEIPGNKQFLKGVYEEGIGDDESWRRLILS
ncbi:hypothetical protein ACFFK0_30290 [Paenibacillus chartarius]|uniref:GNAT family N-acetyltransferase n=1 Tax=Paenibacillus chartarius TaxID=747481 RepID=A0ABV6DVM1_9BACL